jgi:hypothetical protein
MSANGAIALAAHKKGIVHRDLKPINIKGAGFRKAKNVRRSNLDDSPHAPLGQILILQAPVMGVSSCSFYRDDETVIGA